MKARERVEKAILEDMATYNAIVKKHRFKDNLAAATSLAAYCALRELAVKIGFDYDEITEKAEKELDKRV